MNNEKKFSYKALVVDDNEINLLMLINTLKQFKVQADSALNGLEALNICRKKKYDMIFIDHMMPEMDGLQTTEAIRKVIPRDWTTAIIILSAEVTKELRELYLMAGANRIFVKPLMPADISELLQEHNIDARIDINRIGADAINPKVKLEASLRDLQTGINHIIRGIETDSPRQQYIGTHKLINVFISLGETRLLEKAKMFEKMIVEGKTDRFYEQYIDYIKELVDFINVIYSFVKDDSLLAASDNTDDYIPMSSGEYEQSLINAIYYIRRFEYDYIIKELQHLVQNGRRENRQEIEAALQEIRQYQYDRALLRMIKIKKMTGNLPVPDIRKHIILECFWD